MNKDIFVLDNATGPLVSAAIHSGHSMRDEVAEICALSDSERLREEDPHTDMWTLAEYTRMIVLKSRFEVDLNRPRNKAVYLKPEDAWGLKIWKKQPDRQIVKRSLEEYDAFYKALGSVLEKIEKKYKRFIVLDLHSYNHRRNGPDSMPAAQVDNPEVNVGTGSMDRDYWAPVVEAFLRGLRGFDYFGRSMDVRENVKFKGGYFGKWIHENFPNSGCCLSIEFKKTFMDEWSGSADLNRTYAIQNAIRATTKDLLDALRQMKSKRTRQLSAKSISQRTIINICNRLDSNLRVRRSMPLKGRLHIDRQLPFLCVNRFKNKKQQTGISRLVKGEASYLVASQNKELKKSLVNLTEAIIDIISKKFGACLLLEIKEMPQNDGSSASETESDRYRPYFRIKAAGCEKENLAKTVEGFAKNLEKIRIQRKNARVSIEYTKTANPGSPAPLLGAKRARSLNCSRLILEVAPVYYDFEAQTMYPVLLSKLHRGLSRALKHAVFDFTRRNTTHRPAHFQVLGRRAVVKAVWETDQKLSDINDTFDFLLLVTPTNIRQAWLKFKRKRFQEKPRFYYRPLPIDPDLVRRKLYTIPIERIEDPAIAFLFGKKRDQLARQVTMLTDRETRKFRYGSLQIYGNVTEQLYNAALLVLRCPPACLSSIDTEPGLNVSQLAQAANKELDYYRKQYPEMDARVEIREDLTGIMVSRNRLLLGKDMGVSSFRKEAVLNHEIGTHLLTYFNGKAEPFGILTYGLAGYDKLQEGLAVLAEYLVGGLTLNRLRTLAGRVAAVKCMLDGADFIETFRELSKSYGFSQEAAFKMTTRIYRCGGLTKDMVYLDGFIEILEYIGKGGELEPLLVGKIAMDQIQLIKELLARKVIKPGILKPRYLQNKDVQKRLNEIRNGLTITDIFQLGDKHEGRILSK